MKQKVLWVTIAVVDAKIPMLLGNNILKPLEAEIKLFSSGNGVLVLKDEEIELVETGAGHYTIKVSDLGKLCRLPKYFECEECDLEFESITNLKNHTKTEHEAINRVSNCFECNECGKEYKSKTGWSIHMEMKHRANQRFECKVCDEIFKSSKGLCGHMEVKHKVEEPAKSAMKKKLLENHVQNQIIKDIEGELSLQKINTDLNTLMNSSPSRREMRMIKTMRNIASLKVSCDQCEEKTQIESNNEAHKVEEHEPESVFLLHHMEEIDDSEVELDFNVWEIFLTAVNAQELTENEKKEVLKLHKYFAHRNAKKLWDNLFLPAGRLKGKKRLVEEFLDKCEICRKFRRTPSRPKVGLPKAKDMNDVVSLDLKILKKSGNKEVAILYFHDEFTKLNKGQVINDKGKDTIIKAIENKWIIGGGAGPGHPSRGFFSDNGGEFLNQDLIDFAAALDITIRMTAAASPWMNGGCERSHATVDRLVEKILEDDPNVGIQKAVDLACFVKNSEINKSGFSSIQLVCGKAPHFPGYSDCTPGSIELEGNNEYLKILRRMDTARIAARQIDCNQRIKVALKSQINSACGKTYSYGDSVWFKLDSSHKWKSGKVLGQDGKVIFIKYGNFIRRVPLDRIVPADEYVEDDEVNIDAHDVENDDRMEDDNFENVEVVAKKDMEIERLKKTNKEQLERITEMEREPNRNKDLNEGSSRMENVSEKKKVLELPKSFKKIRFRVVGDKSWIHGKVLTKHKNKSIYRNVVGIKLDDGSVKEFDFSRDIEDWDEENTVMEEVLEPCCPVFHTNVLTKAEAKKRTGLKDAMDKEIKKFESFGAFKRVTDEGQPAIKTRWVYSENDDSKGETLKARLCMRGDTEDNKESIRADSPTANKDSLKLGLAIAANEKFNIFSGDIRSAFLQGKSLQRTVHVVPPPEANEEGNLWLLEKGAYGLIDGSRLFFLELKKTLEILGMKPLSGDSAFFTCHKEGKLIGFVCIHVDDLLMCGNSMFENLIIKRIMKQFKFSKLEKRKFTYLGCEIEQLPSGNITLNQNEYIKNIKEVFIPSRSNSCRVTEFERKEIRRVVGELLWVSIMTRPDLAFEVNQLSSNISDASIRELKDARRLVDKAKLEPLALNFSRIGNFENLRIKLYADASYNNQDNKVRSTEGRVLLLEDDKSTKASIFAWKTKKISRVCRSVKGAETRALENGLDEAIHYARMVTEIFAGAVDLKNPKQVDVVALTDNKGLWENLHNSRQCDEKILRNSIALMKEMIEKSEVKYVRWVETSSMLADVLTKRGGSGSWIKDILAQNRI